jgi:hypothetical protein
MVSPEMNRKKRPAEKANLVYMLLRHFRGWGLDILLSGPHAYEVGFNPLEENSDMRTLVCKLCLGLLLAAPLAAFSQGAKDDIKKAGTETKDAAKDTGRATKKAAKKTGHAVKKTSKKVTHKAAKGTRKGAEKVEDKTAPPQ